MLRDMNESAHRDIRLLSYNILNGGMGRLDPIYETLLYLDADVIALNEADETSAAYLARKIGCEYALAEANCGGAYDVALLSRLPIERMVNLGVRFPRLGRTAMEAIVTVGGEPWRIIAAHLTSGLDADDEQRRLTEVEAVLTAIGEERYPTVLMGDLNASAAYHPFDPDAVTPRVRQRVAARGGRVDHAVIDRLLESGLVDAYHQIHPRDARHTFSTGFPALRIDYILLDAALAPRLIDADIERGGFAPYCSDHYPIWATLRRSEA